jgi:cytochrome-b5 reductase
VSTNAAIGSFQLLVRGYAAGGLSQTLTSLNPGDTMSFKHIQFNVKKQYPFTAKRIYMIAGGTGIAPMIQALHCLLGNKDDDTAVTLLYASKTSDDVIARDVLEKWEKDNNDDDDDDDTRKGRFKVVHVLSREPDASDYAGERGRIGKRILAKYLPQPSEDTNVFVCGPPGMYESLCGERSSEEVGGVLAEMGYGKEQVVKF